jgi:hypothetical protein
MQGGVWIAICFEKLWSFERFACFWEADGGGLSLRGKKFVLASDELELVVKILRDNSYFLRAQIFEY